jgi:hypothetical protein
MIAFREEENKLSRKKSVTVSRENGVQRLWRKMCFQRVKFCPPPHY